VAKIVTANETVVVDFVKIFYKIQFELLFFVENRCYSYTSTTNTHKLFSQVV